MNTTSLPLTATDVAARLGIGNDARRRRRRQLAAAAVLIPVAAAVVALLLSRRRGEAVVRYETTPVARGTLVETVSATGTLQPVNEVEVGSEVSGTIASVDVDFNDVVRTNQVLARLDTSKLAAQVAQSESALASATAKVLDAEATVQEAEAQLARLRQVRELSGGRVPSQAEFASQEATVARARAAVASARAAVAQAQATLDLNRSDLAKTVIRSPIDGIVLTRRIEPGQTVAASFEAPVLFTLAEDLAKLELQVDVDEADVGLVHDGQEAVFTVDAYPDKRFPARIVQVRYGSTTTEGVVTYPTILRVANDDLALRPGMTATAVVTTRKAADALLVPNGALRFEPPRPVAAGAAPRPKGSLLGSLLPHPPQRGPKQPANGAGNGTHRRVFVLEGDGRLRAVEVTTGLTDGVQTEVTGGGLEPGMAVVTAIAKTTP